MGPTANRPWPASGMELGPTRVRFFDFGSVKVRCGINTCCSEERGDESNREVESSGRERGPERGSDEEEERPAERADDEEEKEEDRSSPVANG